VGLYGQGPGTACAIASTSTTSYVRCEGGARQDTGLGAIATSQGFQLSRILSVPQSDGSIVFFSRGKYAAISAVVLTGSTFSSVQYFESSVSFPGGAASVGGLATACVIGSDEALGVADLGSIVTRTRDGVRYSDCRAASDGSRLYVVGVADQQGGYAAISDPLAAATPGSTSTLSTVPIAVDASSPFEVVFFDGKPRLVRLDAGGNLQLSEIANDGSLGAPRVLATGVDGWSGQATAGPDGGLHLAFDAGGHVSYAKRCP
jgi:hypothetical protein